MRLEPPAKSKPTVYSLPGDEPSRTWKKILIASSIALGLPRWIPPAQYSVVTFIAFMPATGLRRRSMPSILYRIVSTVLNMVGIYHSSCLTPLR